GNSLYGQSSLPCRLSALAGAYRERREDVQVQRDGTRSGGTQSAVRNGCDAVLSGVDGCAGDGYSTVRGQTGKRSEFCKQNLDCERALVAWTNLFAAFEAALWVLHPFMPFLTEELWQQLPQKTGAKSIALDEFPVAAPRWSNDLAERQMRFLQGLISFPRAV